MSTAIAAANVDVVVFDIGNVLIRWDPRNLYRQLGYADVDIAAVIAETGLAEINHRQLDAGAPFGATIAALAARFPHHAPFVQAFHARWEEMLGGAIDTTIALVDELKEAGVPVHAISNFSREKFDIARARFPVLDRFDELIVSGDVGMVKPDAEIFELLIKRRDLTPARAVFIDDSAANIATARRLGFATIHFTEGETDLRAELAGLRLITPSASALRELPPA
jgi:2-haloacid dehalogenase